mmetsp:Transcript_1475/g.3985  ORF Transcript_1475/g.3985 Transcript_1475/m.3985 type:complete len:160 (+) Transcript_1475:213-692(+)
MPRYRLLVIQSHAAPQSQNASRSLSNSQGKFWTVFKGLPEPSETPRDTALREFREETGAEETVLDPATTRFETTLHGSTGKKNLEIFLVDGAGVSESIFNPDKVVKIDSGFLKGRPEIVAIRWMTFGEAMAGIDGARIYNSQESILQHAENFINTKPHE